MQAGKLLAAGTAGALGLWAGFPNNLAHFPPAVFLWPLALVYLGLHAPAAARAARYGWLCTFAGMACALYWLYLPVYTVGKLPVIAAVGCSLFICACLALQGLSYCLGVFYIRRAGIFSFSALAALLWYLLEELFAALIGVPWLPLCGALPAWPALLQGAAYAGGYLLGAAWLFFILLITLGLCGFGGRRRMKAAFLGGFAMLSLAAFGFWRLGAHPMENGGFGAEGMAALFVEGNVDQNQKWERAFQASTLDLYIWLTKAGIEALPEEDRENLLLLWPETAMPFFLEASPHLERRLLGFVREAGYPLLFGAPGLEKGRKLQESPVFNRAYLVSPSGKIEGFYDKEHLVPFGEYAPPWLKLGFLEPLLQGVGIYEPGRDASPLRSGSLALGMLICYEGIFPWMAQERVSKGANLLVDISNDGWFGGSPAALQHLYLTIVRCMEQNRWLLRATNTGYSAIADNFGRLVLKGPSFKTGFIYGKARLIEEKSVYHAIADYIPWAALACFALLLPAAARGGNPREGFKFKRA